MAEEQDEYLFDAMEDDDLGCTVLIVKRSFWEEHGHADSRHLTHELEGKLPDVIIDEIAESIFLSELDRDETVAALKAEGFVHEPRIGAVFNGE